MKDDKLNSGLFRLELFKFAATQSYIIKDREFKNIKSLRQAEKLTSDQEKLLYELHEAHECLLDDLTYSVIMDEELNPEYTELYLEKIKELYEKRSLEGIEIAERCLASFRDHIIDGLGKCGDPEFITGIEQAFKIVFEMIDDERESLFSQMVKE